MKYLKFTKSNSEGYVNILRSSIMAVNDDPSSPPEEDWAVIHTYSYFYNVKESRLKVMEMIANPNKEE